MGSPDRESTTTAWPDLDSIRDSFRGLWNSARRPNLRSYLRAQNGHPEYQELAFTVTKIHLSRRLKAGDQAPLVEEQLEDLRAVGAELDSAQRIDLIRLEYDERWGRGEYEETRREE